MPEPLLELRAVSAGYGKALVLRGCTLRVLRGEIVALLGANGAGKTTALRAASGLLAFHRGAVVDGDVFVGGARMTGESAQAFVAAGVAHCLEGRRLFSTLSVEENLRLGSAASKSDAWRDPELEELFPVLRQRRHERAGLLSGGEQQMVAIARALGTRPSLLLLDEPTLGLAPMLVEQVLDLVMGLRDRGTTVVLVEQHAARAAEISDRTYVIGSGGATALDPDGGASSTIASAYFGGSASGALVDPRRRAPWN